MVAEKPNVGRRKAQTPTTVPGPGHPRDENSASAPFELPYVTPRSFDEAESSQPPSALVRKAAGVRFRAAKNLLTRSEERLIYHEVRAGTSQAKIAKIVGRSQPTVSRMVKRIQRSPSPLELSPTEVISQREVGQIDDEQMMDKLLSHAFTAGRYDPTGGDGFVRGDWSQVEEALAAGLLTDQEYERIAREARTETSADE